ncbi:MAG TPA: hypothetical protein VHX64_03230, partial [Caulobacteraceae bacterium]|nr:hypothetical protein [Caulobacteraceae bacterium]
MAERPEEPETEGAEPTSPGSGSIAAAMTAALRRRRKGDKGDPEFDAFLRKQSRLIDLQTEHLHEQRTLILSRLRWGRFSDRLKALLQVLTLLVGLALVAVVAVMAWQAHEDHGLTIAAFSVPPDLAQRGLTGQVVASKLQDRLSRLQAQTVSARPASSYADDWGSDIKVEIPETGVSIGELDRYLRQWLGSETKITGEVVRTPTGLAITARAGANPGETFTGQDAGFDALLAQAAQAVYGETQPYRYAVYLASTSRPDEAVRIFQRLARSGDGAERAWAYAGWGTLLLGKGDAPGAVDKAKASVSLDPRLYPARLILGISLDGLGRDEEQLAALRSEHALLGDGGLVGLPPAASAARRRFVLGVEDYLVGDYREAAAILRSFVGAAIDFEGRGQAYDTNTFLAF